MLRASRHCPRPVFSLYLRQAQGALSDEARFMVRGGPPGTGCSYYIGGGLLRGVGGRGTPHLYLPPSDGGKRERGAARGPFLRRGGGAAGRGRAGLKPAPTPVLRGTGDEGELPLIYIMCVKVGHFGTFRSWGRLRVQRWCGRGPPICIFPPRDGGRGGKSLGRKRADGGPFLRREGGAAGEEGELLIYMCIKVCQKCNISYLRAPGRRRAVCATRVSFRGRGGVRGIIARMFAGSRGRSGA